MLEIAPSPIGQRSEYQTIDLFGYFSTINGDMALKFDTPFTPERVLLALYS